jgi:hypothetical protein
MTLQAKYLDYAVPDRLALKYLGNRDALQMLRFRAVQVANHVPKLLDVRHAHASSKSPTLQKDRSTPLSFRAADSATFSNSCSTWASGAVRTIAPHPLQGEISFRPTLVYYKASLAISTAGVMRHDGSGYSPA